MGVLYVSLLEQGVPFGLGRRRRAGHQDSLLHHHGPSFSLRSFMVFDVAYGAYREFAAAWLCDIILNLFNIIGYTIRRSPMGLPLSLKLVA